VAALVVNKQTDGQCQHITKCYVVSVVDKHMSKDAVGSGASVKHVCVCSKASTLFKEWCIPTPHPTQSRFSIVAIALNMTNIFLYYIIKMIL
jgi:hypothetical protein